MVILNVLVSYQPIDAEMDCKDILEVTNSVIMAQEKQRSRSIYPFEWIFGCYAANIVV